MNIIQRIIALLKYVLFNRMFWIGFIICFGFFSKYILGPDNLLEEIGEKQLKDNFDIDVDFSPQSDNTKP